MASSIFPASLQRPRWPRLTRVGCAVTMHELIRFDHARLLYRCRCGRRAITHREFLARYGSTPSTWTWPLVTQLWVGETSIAAADVTWRTSSSRTPWHLRAV